MLKRGKDELLLQSNFSLAHSHSLALWQEVEILTILRNTGIIGIF